MWKIKNLICMLLHISILNFIRLNFLSRRVIRKKGGWIIPFRGTRVSIAKGAYIEVHGHIKLNGNKQRHSRQECLVLLRRGAKWIANGDVFLYYGTTLQVHKNATLITGNSVNCNTGSTIICACKTTIGNYFSTARGVFIFDSDHHPVYNAEGKRINEPKEIVIEDHVWLGLKTTVMKGSHIGTGTVVGAHSLISGEIPPHCMVASVPARPVMKDIFWER